MYMVVCIMGWFVTINKTNTSRYIIELFIEAVNKLKHKSKDVDDIFNDLPE